MKRALPAIIIISLLGMGWIIAYESNREESTGWKPHDFGECYRMVYLVGFNHGQNDFWSNVKEWESEIDKIIEHFDGHDNFPNREDLIKAVRELQERIKSMSFTNETGPIPPIYDGSAQAGRY